MVNVPEVVSATRQQRELDEPQLADFFGVSEDTIVSWETETTKPRGKRMWYIVKLVETYNIKVDIKLERK